MTAPAFPATPREAITLQQSLRRRIVRVNRFRNLRTVAGADVALDDERGIGFAGVIVFSLSDLVEVERAGVRGPLHFPYVPGLLTFREGPLLLEAFARLRARPDLLMFDGHGFAHPRRCGIASHVSLLLGRPGIGIAKSRLVGTHREPASRAGSTAPLIDARDGEVIGAAVRTRDSVRPIYVSIGHRVDLDTAVTLALACTDGTRIPKPTREADRFVTALKRAARANAARA